MRNYKAKDVDEYIKNAPIESQRLLKEVREVVLSIHPEIQEGISWGIPFYRYKGLLSGYSVFTSHVTFGMGGENLSEDTVEKLEKKGYKTAKKTFQIRFDQEPPKSIIKQLLKAQITKNEAKLKKP